MKLNRASIYALHALVYRALHADARIVASHAIAANRGIADRFLLKLLKPLAGCGALVSRKGLRGGYRLARPAATITLLEVIEAVDGPLRSDLASRSGNGQSGTDRKLQTGWDQVSTGARQQFQAVAVAELVGQSKPMKRTRAGG